MVDADPSPQQFRELMLGEEPELEEVLVCVFNIQRHEARTYNALLGQPNSTVEELADEHKYTHAIRSTTHSKGYEWRTYQFWRQQ